MPEFRYRARDASGAPVEGLVEAADMGAAAGLVAARGLIPVDIKPAPAKPESIGALWMRLTERKPGHEELMLYSRQQHTLINAGVPLDEALSGIVRSTPSRPMARALSRLREAIASGQPLSQAMRTMPAIFPRLYVALVRVGEASGQLGTVFLALARYLESDRDMRQRVAGALRYPLMVIGAIAIAVAILNVMVIPAFAKLYSGFGVPLPLPTRIIIATSELTLRYWPLFLTLIAGAFVGWRLWRATDEGALAWDKIKLRLPIIGPIVQRASIGRLARALALALRSGVPLIDALASVSGATGNRFVDSAVEEIRRRIVRGETFAQAAAGSPVLTPMVVQMIDVGESTGELDRLLDEVGGFYEREVDYRVRNLATTIEPLLISAVAVLVLILALGVFLPMWDLALVKLHGG